MKLKYKCVFLLLFCTACQINQKHLHQTQKLIACGSNKVIILDIENTKDKSKKILWEWQPNYSKRLPKIYKDKYLNHIDECKPLGNEILITSSTGGVVIIDRKTKDVSFYTYIENAHSMEALPNNRVVVAGSNSVKGNCIAVFDRNSFEQKSLYKDSLYSAHGVVWDNNSKMLYALGFDVLRVYNLVNWETKIPSLELLKEWKLPTKGGHDLLQHPINKDELIITTHATVWKFNKKEKVFNEYKPLSGVQNVKGLSISKKNKIAYIRAEEKWWSNNIYLTTSNNRITIPTINLYKVRWCNFD